MSVLVCGSIAYDSIMVFHDRFKNHILPEQIHILNVAFLVPDLRREFGGCAGNTFTRSTSTEVDMDASNCDVASTNWTHWHDIPWQDAHQVVGRLQARIAKAAKAG